MVHFYQSWVSWCFSMFTFGHKRFLAYKLYFCILINVWAFFNVFIRPFKIVGIQLQIVFLYFQFFVVVVFWSKLWRRMFYNVYIRSLKVVGNLLAHRFSDGHPPYVLVCLSSRPSSSSSWLSLTVIIPVEWHVSLSPKPGGSQITMANHVSRPIALLHPAKGRGGGDTQILTRILRTEKLWKFQRFSKC